MATKQSKDSVKKTTEKVVKTLKTSAKNAEKSVKAKVAENKRKNAASKTSRVKTVDNDDLTVVVKGSVFGLASKYALVQHYNTTTGETTLMTSNPSFDREEVVTQAQALAKKLNVLVAVEEV